MALNRAEVGGELIKVAAGAGFETWRRERPPGTLRVHWSGRGAVRMHVEGCGAGDFARIVIGRYEQAVRENGAVSILYDLAKMQNYDTRLRQELTEWCLKHRHSISAMHLHAESTVVVMGATVANLLLRGMMTIHAERGTFDDAVRENGLTSIRT